MEKTGTIGLDIEKNVFQVHGVDKSGRVVVQRRLGRRQVRSFFERRSPCLLGMEACATTYGITQPVAVRGKEPLTVDRGRVIANLSGAVQIPTISFDERDAIDPSWFAAFREFLAVTFPSVFETMTREIVAGHSLPLIWPGNDPELDPILFSA